MVTWGSTNPSLNIYVINDVMTRKGWHLSVLHVPSALHMCVTPANEGSISKPSRTLSPQ